MNSFGSFQLFEGNMKVCEHSGVEIFDTNFYTLVGHISGGTFHIALDKITSIQERSDKLVEIKKKLGIRT